MKETITAAVKYCFGVVWFNILLYFAMTFVFRETYWIKTRSTCFVHIGDTFYTFIYETREWKSEHTLQIVYGNTQRSLIVLTAGHY